MIQILVLFIIYTIVLLIFGINNAFVIAFICALMNLIPYVGPLISGFLMMILTMTSNMGASFSEVVIPKTTYVMIGFIIGQLIDNFVSQPIIFSKSVKSHPLEIFIVITSGVLFGVIGMVVAIPTYTAVKVILKEFFYMIISLSKNSPKTFNINLNRNILTKEAQQFINDHINTDLSKLLLKPSPFKNISVTDLANQIICKTKSKTKLPSWYNSKDIMYPNPLNIEQTSSEITAQYKSKLLRVNV